MSRLWGAAALFGFAALFGRWIELPSVALVLGRVLVAWICLLPWWGARTGSKRGPWLGGGLLALHWTAFFAAVRLGGVALALLGYAVYPLAAWALEAGWRRARRQDGVAALLCGAGLALLALAEPPRELVPAPALGLALGLVAGVLFALLARLNERLLERIAPLALTGRECGVAALLLLPFGATDLLAASARDWAGLLVLGVLCTALAHGLFVAGIQRAGTLAASGIASLEPVFGLLLAALLLREAPTGLQLAGALPLLVGAGLLSSGRIRRADDGADRTAA